jgi:hypothetical protein
MPLLSEELFGWCNIIAAPIRKISHAIIYAEANYTHRATHELRRRCLKTPY